MADELKNEVVQVIRERLASLDGHNLVSHPEGFPGQTLHIELMRGEIGKLEMQFSVRTSAGPRFFHIKISEKF